MTFDNLDYLDQQDIKRLSWFASFIVQSKVLVKGNQHLTRVNKVETSRVYVQSPKHQTAKLSANYLDIYGLTNGRK